MTLPYRLGRRTASRLIRLSLLLACKFQLLLYYGDLAQIFNDDLI